MNSYIHRIVTKFSFDEKWILFNFVLLFFPNYISEFLIASSTLYLLSKADKRRKIFATHHIIWIALWGIVALSTGYYYGNNLGVAYGALYMLFTIFAIYAWDVMTPRLSTLIIRVGSAISVGLFMIAAVQRLLGTVRPSATFSNPNLYGYVCELMILLAVFALIVQRKRHSFYWIVILANMSGILLSGCRSAWIATFGGTIILFICLKRYKSFYASVSLIPITGLFLYFNQQLIPRVSDISETITTRSEIWKTAYYAIRTFPLFGNGFLSYRYISAGVGMAHASGGQIIAHAHNIFLDMLVNFGIIGSLFALIFCVYALRLCIKSLPYNPSAAIGIAVFVALMIHGITDVPVWGFHTGTITMLLITLAGTQPNPPIVEDINTDIG